MASSGEKTEKGTPKKRADARKEGQVLKSQELSTAVLLLVVFGTLWILGEDLFDSIKSLAIHFFNGSINITDRMNPARLSSIFGDLIYEFILMLLPLMLVSVLIGIVANLVQVGFLFTGKAVRPKFSKINPLQGFKRMFSMRSIMEMIKAVLKCVIIGAIVYLEFMRNFDKFANLMYYDLMDVLSLIADMCINVAFQAGIGLIILGVIDYVYQWWEYEKNLKMTKQEVKDEFKMMEGDPKIKAKIKEKQRQMAMSRMMSAVPAADVVITNPTHYAVALMYDEEKSPAPVVVAKGKDLVAKRIKTLALENHVEIVENKPLAQALYVAVDIGQMIPEDMYAAVADILAYVYKIKHPDWKNQRK